MIVHQAWLVCRHDRGVARPRHVLEHIGPKALTNRNVQLAAPHAAFGLEGSTRIEALRLELTGGAFFVDDLRVVPEPIGAAPP